MYVLWDYWINNLLSGLYEKYFLLLRFSVFEAVALTRRGAPVCSLCSADMLRFTEEA